LILFRNKSFILFVLGQATSSLGINLLNFAIAFYIFQITGSAEKYASIMALMLIPNIIFSPFAGTITDRINRKKLIVLGDFLRGAFELVLFIYSLKFNIEVEFLYIIVVFFSICNTFLGPAFTTILPTIIAKEQLAEAISTKSTIGRIIGIGSPLIGALLVKLLGFRITLLIDAITYFIGGITTLLMEIPLIATINKKDSFFETFADGLKVVFSNNKVFLLMLNNLLTNLFIIPFIVIGVPFIVLQLLGGNQLDYGVVQSAASLGSILSIFAVIWTKRRCSINKCLNIGVIILVISCSLITPLFSNTILRMLYSQSTYIDS
jgi:MFS family permease